MEIFHNSTQATRCITTYRIHFLFSTNITLTPQSPPPCKGLAYLHLDQEDLFNFRQEEAAFKSSRFYVRAILIISNNCSHSQEMGFGTPDGFCNSGLGLGLGCHDKKETGSPSDHHHLQPKKRPSLKYDHLIPSLTLGPATKIESDMQPKASSLSPVSSFSNSSSVKKEREFVDEEVEVERVVSRGCDEDEEPSPRKKLRLSKEQASILEDSFKEHSTLNPKQKQGLADQLNLSPRQVEVWFQNRRARTKLKQTEVEFELLKKCCETLTDENKRLQKELQELKSVKPLYMQLPAATLTMCPSCERIGSGSGGDGPSTTAFVVGRKPSLYDPFTHQPAAC